MRFTFITAQLVGSAVKVRLFFYHPKSGSLEVGNWISASCSYWSNFIIQNNLNWFEVVSLEFFVEKTMKHDFNPFLLGKWWPHVIMDLSYHNTNGGSMSPRDAVIGRSPQDINWLSFNPIFYDMTINLTSNMTRLKCQSPETGSTGFFVFFLRIIQSSMNSVQSWKGKNCNNEGSVQSCRRSWRVPLV